MNSFPLSQKYLDFINTVDNVDADFLEGTTASGKTTVGAGVKFMRMVSRSRKKLHIIASKTTGTAEKNIIQQDNGYWIYIRMPSIVEMVIRIIRFHISSLKER